MAHRYWWHVRGKRTSNGRLIDLEFGFANLLVLVKQAYPATVVWLVWDGLRRRTDKKRRDNTRERQESWPQRLAVMRSVWANVMHTAYNQQYEADEEIAALCGHTDAPRLIVSTDQDFRALLDSDTSIAVSFASSRTAITAQSHTADTGVAPNRWSWFRALTGDKSDAIKGVPRLRKRDAARVVSLLSDHVYTTELVQTCVKAGLSYNMVKRVRSYADTVICNYSMIELNTARKRTPTELMQPSPRHAQKAEQWLHALELEEFAPLLL